MKTRTERRRHQRFTLQPMYTPVAVVEGIEDGALDSERFDLEGHAYDISEGGVRFELDRPLKPGTKVAMQITLPTMGATDVGPGRSVLVFATVVRIEDEDEPGPVRTAVKFDRFARLGDRERLLRQFATGQYRVAA